MKLLLVLACVLVAAQSAKLQGFALPTGRQPFVTRNSFYRGLRAADIAGYSNSIRSPSNQLLASSNGASTTGYVYSGPPNQGFSSGPRSAASESPSLPGAKPQEHSRASTRQTFTGHPDQSTSESLSQSSSNSPLQEAPAGSNVQLDSEFSSHTLTGSSRQASTGLQPQPLVATLTHSYSVSPNQRAFRPSNNLQAELSHPTQPASITQPQSVRATGSVNESQGSSFSGSLAHSTLVPTAESLTESTQQTLSRPSGQTLPFSQSAAAVSGVPLPELGTQSFSTSSGVPLPETGIQSSSTSSGVPVPESDTQSFSTSSGVPLPETGIQSSSTSSGVPLPESGTQLFSTSSGQSTIVLADPTPSRSATSLSGSAPQQFTGSHTPTLSTSRQPQSLVISQSNFESSEQLFSEPSNQLFRVQLSESSEQSPESAELLVPESSGLSLINPSIQSESTQSSQSTSGPSVASTLSSTSFSGSVRQQDIITPEEQFHSSAPESFDQDSSISSEVDLVEGNCPEGEVLHVNGRCLKPEITRNVFLFNAPKEEVKFAAVPQDIPLPRIEHNIVFIRTSQNGNRQEPIIIPPPQRKHIIYVLNKESEYQRQRVIELPTPAPRNPEVYFVNYADGENPTLPDGTDFETALRSAVHVEGLSIDDKEELNNNFGDDSNFVANEEIDTSFTGDARVFSEPENVIMVTSNTGSIVASTADSNVNGNFVDNMNKINLITDTAANVIVDTSIANNNGFSENNGGIFTSINEGNVNFNVRTDSEDSFEGATGFTDNSDNGFRSSPSSSLGYEVSSTINNNFGTSSAAGVALPSTLYNTP